MYSNALTRLSSTKAVGANAFLVGGGFTVADAYLFTVLGWGSEVGVDMGQWPNLLRYHTSIGARPAVIEALRAEGLSQ